MAASVVRNSAKHARTALFRGVAGHAVRGGTAVALNRSAFHFPAQRRNLSTPVKFTLEEPEEMLFPNENPEKGVSYDLNWSICGSGVVPQGLAFRNLRTPQLEAAGGLKSLDLPTSVPFTKEIDREVTEGLGEQNLTLYVQDMALGALLANEVHVRIVSDSAAAASMFKDLCSTTRIGEVHAYEEDVTVLLLSNTKMGPFVSVDSKKNTVYMGGTINASLLVPAMQELSTDAFLKKSVLPMWGSGDTEAVYLSSGFEQDSTVKHGFAYSQNGFCRMFMGSVRDDGSVNNEYSAMPNNLELPKAVVMFANDATCTVPAACELTPAQAAFYYVAACSAPGCTEFEAAAQLVMQMAEKVPFYMVNEGSFADKEAARTAARGLPGSKGGASDALGLKVIDVSGSQPQASGAEAEAGAKALADKVASRCKTLDAVLAAGPSVSQ